MCWLMTVTGDSGGVINVCHCSDDVMASPSPSPPPLPFPPTPPSPHPLTVPPSSRCSHTLARLVLKAALLASRPNRVLIQTQMQPFFCVLLFPHLSVCPLRSRNWEKMFRKRRSNLLVGCVRPSASLAQPGDEL